jgi:asparaginyl-tRNA synthetase
MKTKRHLPEYWRIEAAQQCELDTIIRVQEELVAHICHTLSEESRETLKCFNRSFKDLARVQKPFPQLTYDEAIDMLQEDGFKISWGQKIDWKLENHISLKFDRPFFIVKFPLDTETYFLKSDPEKPELTLSVDMLAPEGYGELSSGAQMITQKEVMSKKMTEENIDPADQLWYINLMQCTEFPHSGFAIGLERFIQWICKLQHVKEAIAFPRLHDSNFC